MKDIRCRVCKSEFESAVLMATHEPDCPICRTSVKPVQIQHDGYVKLNWEDVRTLAIYAQRWAEQFDTNNLANLDYIKMLRNIVKSLEIYQPKNSRGLDATQDPIKQQNGKGIKSPYFL